MDFLQRLYLVLETCTCQKVFTTNWWQLTPYTTDEDNTAVGIFPDVLKHAIKFCCSECVYGDKAAINFVGSNKTKSLQRGIIEVRQHLGEDIDFHFPIHGTKYKTTYGNGFPYVPLVHSPGAAFIVSSFNSFNESGRVMNLILNSWTFIIVLVFSSYVVGLIMWLIVRDININICTSRIGVQSFAVCLLPCQISVHLVLSFHLFYHLFLFSYYMSIQIRKRVGA